MIIKNKISIKDLAKLLDQPEEVKEITFSRGAYNHLPKKAVSALKKMGVELKVMDLKRGRKAAVDTNKLKVLMESGLSADEISQRMRIPLRTVYYHLRKLKSR